MERCYKMPANDQYASGNASDLWQLYLPTVEERTAAYHSELKRILKKYNCRSILDAACGTGIDSAILVSKRYDVVSTDVSDALLRHATKLRWENREHKIFDRWIIEKANWLTLEQDLLTEEVDQVTEGFDAVLCIGSSFPQLADRRQHAQALQQLHNAVKPGGILIIDHRNYDYVLDTGSFPVTENIYYTDKYVESVDCYVVYKNGEPHCVTTDCVMRKKATSSVESSSSDVFTLTSYPHRVAGFTQLLKDTFGKDTNYELLGNYQPINPAKTVGFYIHIIQKEL